jgi:predicted HicB family RNase H-like nuclease
VSGRPKVYNEPRVSTGLRLPKSLHERILAMADERDVSANWLITRAIERYVEAEVASMLRDGKG